MEKINHFSVALLLAFWLVFFVFPGFDRAGAVVTKRIWSSPDTGHALDAYDPVAYFTDSTPRKGLAEYEYVWAGVAWRFVNEGNMDAFRRNPEVYAPQFGGYGALGVSRKTLLPPNPLHWGLYEKKLYLFNTQKAKRKWEKDVKDHLPQARNNWKLLLNNLDE